MYPYRDMPPLVDPARRPRQAPNFSVDKVRQEMLDLPRQVGRFAGNVPAGIAHLPFDITAGPMDLVNMAGNAMMPGQPFNTNNRSAAIDWAAQRGLTPQEPTGADLPGYRLGGVMSPAAWGKGAQLAGKGVDAGLQGLQNMQTLPQLPRGLQPLMPSPVQPMTAYHGTPHKFPPTEKNPLGEFDMAKMGTGEGAQAYGHGIYLAENPGVAQAYKMAGGLGDTPIRKYGPGPAVDKLAAKIRHDYQDVGRSDDLLEAFSRDELSPGLMRFAESLEKKGELAEFMARSKQASDAHLYDVDLPDKHIARMLDWDAPLSEQPESVRKALGQLPDKALRDRLFGRTNADTELTGANIYGELSDYMAGGRSKSLYDAAGRGQADASAEMRELGIPGLKYYDQGSRAAGEGTRNFVAFDPSIANITARNGMPAPMQNINAAPPPGAAQGQFGQASMPIGALDNVPGNALRKSPAEMAEFTKKIQSGEINPPIIVETVNGVPVNIQEGNHTLAVKRALGQENVDVRLMERGGAPAGPQGPDQRIPKNPPSWYKPK